jgi:hypothetical protein
MVITIPVPPIAQDTINLRRPKHKTDLAEIGASYLPTERQTGQFAY